MQPLRRTICPDKTSTKGLFESQRNKPMPFPPGTMDPDMTSTEGLSESQMHKPSHLSKRTPSESFPKTRGSDVDPKYQGLIF